MNNSRTINSLKNIITGFLGQFVQLSISFINRIIFVRCLSEAYLGVNGLFTNVLSMLSLAELGISSAISYALYKPLANKDNSKIASLMKFYANAYRIIGCVIAIVGLFLVPFLNKIVADPGSIREDIKIVYLFFLMNTVLSYFYSYKTTLITADQKSYLISTISYIVLFIQTIIQIIVLFLTKNYLLYLVCQSIGTLITNILLAKAADKYYPFIKQKSIEKLSPDDKRSLFSNIKALMIIKISGVLVNSTDNIIISATKGLGLISTGIASNYTLLTTTLNSVMNQIFTGITASVGNVNAISDSASKVKLFNVINLMNFWLYGWSSLGFLFLANDIILILFGEKYLLSSNIVLVLAINYYTVGMQSAVWTYKNTLGLFNYGKFLVLITGLVNIILSIIFGNIFGLFGIYFATFLSRLFTNLWYDPFTVFKYGLNEKIGLYFKKYLFYLLILLFEYLLINVGVLIIGYDKTSFQSFFLKLFFCIFIPNLVNCCAFYKTKEYQYLSYKIKEIIVKFFLKVRKHFNLLIKDRS